MKNFRLSQAGTAVLAFLAVAAACVAGTDFFAGLLGIDWRDAAHNGLTMMEGAAALTIADQIKSFKAKRQQIVDKLKGIVDLVLKEGRSRDEKEREEHAGLTSELQVCDEHIKMLEDHEQLLLAEGTTVDKSAGQEDGGETRGKGAGANNGVLLPGGGRVVQVRRNLPKGIGFTRYSLALAQAKGEIMFAYEIAKNQYADTPEVANCLKAAIAMGGTKNMTLHSKAAVTPVSGTDTAVVQYNDLENEFIDLLRPKMLVGRMEQLDRVPFLSRIGRQLTGVSGAFVGEGAPKPVEKQTYDNVTLGYAKVAVIVVLTDEGARFSTIQAEMRARDDMVKGIATYIDKRFIDPSYSGVANVSPASITNGARRIQSTGSTIAAMDTDVANAQGEFATSNVDPSTAIWVMPASVALKLSMKRNTYDELAFPGMANAVATGRGVWYGLPVLVSNAMIAAGSPAEKQIALVTQEEVMIAEDTGISIDMSREASVQMNDAPSAGAQSLVSLWQNNLLGIRAEQYINWAPKRPNNLGIVLIENTNY